MTSLNDIRSTFLDYFATQCHEVVDSSPLVPRNDPTLMFVNSGMVQFKNRFTGLETRDFVRATTSQKCVRAGGKHNDLDNVGYTARHHTFFEMLGNFSFGDYFKPEAILFAWNLITKEFCINPERLLITVYHTDDEAFEIWKKVGVPESRIIRIDTANNFWQMGPTGPCGPCTEIFYDHGDHIWGGPPGSADEDGDRFIEIWNVVFMQNEQSSDGSMVPLGMQSIDTGMGLERISALLQGSHDNYDTDLFKALIEASAHATHVDPYGEKNVHHRVIADHLRSTSFLMADGVMPSNEGRGYVLRRIMRRAMRHAHLLGAKGPVMHRLVQELVAQMGQAYPELGRAQVMIEETLLNEETRFKATLDRGLKLLDDELSGLEEGKNLLGETAFKLYDTYGFPLDLTQDALREKGRSLDTEGFAAAMEEQKTRARAAWSGSGVAEDATIWFDLAEEHGVTEFLGYDTEYAEGQILALVQSGDPLQSAKAGDEAQIVLNQTPFYAESGGQIGDAGLIRTDTGSARVTDTKKVADVFIHFVTVESGELLATQGAELAVDHLRRRSIRANHSATHLLHAALRNELGEHVAQRGALNADDRLRFDFSHNKAMTPQQLSNVAREMNIYIRQNTKVETRIMTPDDAREIGAQALFGEKYGDEVRVVSMGHAATGKGTNGATYSIEICGGTHVGRTGEIGVCVFLSEGASASGVRRIEALTGKAAYAFIEEETGRASELQCMLKAKPEEVVGRIHGLMDERKVLNNEISALKRKLAKASGAGPEVKELNGIKFLSAVVQGLGGKDLQALVYEYKDTLGSGAVLVIAENDGKVAVSAGVTSDLSDKLSAVDLVKAAVPELGGKGGGGRPELAQGGGASTESAAGAIAAAEAVIAG